MELTNPADIRALLARHDFRFSKSMGQNFLTAAWVPSDIADASGADAHTGVLEVGPGIGCLTEQLAQRAAKVVSVELDERLRPVLAETLAAYPNVEIVFGDVLALDLRQLAAERFPGLRPVVCANLPYNVDAADHGVSHRRMLRHRHGHDPARGRTPALRPAGNGGLRSADRADRVVCGA